MKKLFILIFLLAVKAILIAFLVEFAGIGLGPDEAQYWTWSKELSWGYYSKPPGIAWQIWLGTFFFGDTEFGVRFGSLLLGSVLPIAVFFLAKSAKLSESISFWAAILMAFSPLGFLSTFFAITDVGVVLFWTLCLIPLIYAIEKQQIPNYFLIGFLVACGALFKWQIFWIWLLVLSLLYFYPYLRSNRLFIGIIISLLGLLPSIYWNATHEWATFRHVGATLVTANEQVSKGNFFEFLGAQAALVSPLLFVLLLFSFKDLFQPKTKNTLKILGGSCLAILCIHSFFALFKKMQGNWADYAYPAGFVFLAWFYREGARLKLLKCGIILSIIMTLFAFSLPKLGLKLNPFRHNVGWQNLNEVLLDAGYQSGKDFLFSSTYQTTSVLSFYNREHKRAYFLNLFNIRKNQFSFWPQIQDREYNKNGFYVLVETGTSAEQKIQNQIDLHLAKIQPFFEKVELIGFFPLSNVKIAALVKCSNYNGTIAVSKNKY